MTGPYRWLFRARLPAAADVPEPVHDGDTITLLLDRGLDGTKTDVPLRLQRVLAPELSQPGGVDCRDAVLQWLVSRSRARWPFVVETFRTSTDLHSKVTLARYVAEVSAGGESLNAYLLDYVQTHGYSRGIGS